MQVPNALILCQYRWNTVQNRPFFLSCQTLWQNESMAYKGTQKSQIGFPLFKVSELWKFQKSSFCVKTGEHTVQNRSFFSFMPNWMKKWIIFDKIAYQGLLKYQISVTLFKVSEPWKFQMSSFSISTGETYGSKQATFSLIPNWLKKWVTLDTKTYQGLLKFQTSFP